MPDYSRIKYPFRVSVINLAQHLPLPEARAEKYIAKTIETFNPDVLFMQGVPVRHPQVLAQARSLGTVHTSPNTTMLDMMNATYIRHGYRIEAQDEIRCIANTERGRMELAPDVLADTIVYGGRRMRFYNFQNMPGAFFEEQRTYLASLVSDDAYQHRVKSDKYKTVFRNAIMVLGGNLNARPDSQSIRYLSGLTTRSGYAPSAWMDVWPELCRNMTGYTERTMNVLDRSVILPKFVKPQRKTYMMVYGNIFGRAGSPVKIELNGMETADGMPMSDTYGLDMTMYVPPVAFTQVNDTGPDD